MMLARSFVALAAACLSACAAQRQTMEEAAVDARRILANESEGVLLSVYQEAVAPDEELVGAPIGIMEYFADCSDDGSPTLLVLDIAPNTRNYKAGSKLTLTLRDHSQPNPLQHGRMYIVGSLERVEGRKEQERHAACFLGKHPDSSLVAPGKDIHFSAWYTLKPERVYYFGGFGNVKWIGFLPTDLYASAGNKTLLDMDTPRQSAAPAPVRQPIVFQA
ncbi:hypothetical protein PYCC9005_000114 [Savitreella phatthalungensis]